jgi:hypothetical protein
MTKAYLRSLNELIIQSTLEASDEEISSLIDSPHGISYEKIAVIGNDINVQIKKYRDARLKKLKQNFMESQSQQQSSVEKAAAKLTIDSMLKSIAAVMNRSDELPEGLLLAFREQSGQVGDEAIIEAWKNLVELGLIDPNDIEN